MASLYKRATPPQARVLRIIEGAVKNVADAHGEEYNPRMARSIAKRAAGTLTAIWPEVLAAREALSDSGGALCCQGAIAGSGRHVGISAGLGASEHTMACRRGRPTLARRPRNRLWSLLARKMHEVRASGDEARIEAYIEVLRIIAAARGVK